jgi:hypothetical protein
VARAPQAVLLALELARQPSLAAAVRRRPLPRSGMLDLIRIAGGCVKTCGETARLTRKSPALIKQAAEFYLQHALFGPEANSYRVLGVSADAPQKQLREHMLWLMRWLHPDHNHGDWETIFATRVLEAWDNLKSPERRARYDHDRLRHDTRRAHRALRRGKRRPMTGSHPRGLPWIAVPIDAAPRSAGRRWASVALALLLVAGLAMFLVSGANLSTIAPLAAIDWSKTESSEPVRSSAAEAEAVAGGEE